MAAPVLGRSEPSEAWLPQGSDPVVLPPRPERSVKAAGRVYKEEWMIRTVQLNDGAAICGIYKHYIQRRTLSFEEDPREQSIYLRPGLEGKGLGTRLLTSLLGEVKKTRIHAVIAGITVPNARSVASQEKMGFTKIVQFKEVGFKFDQWLAVEYWKLLLNAADRV
jgi:L-amino acid N-acyltransferase YncA